MATADTDDRDREAACEKVPERHCSDLYVRTGWADANTAFEQLEKGKAKGDRGPLWVRSRLHQHLRALGTFLDTHAGKVLFVALLVVGTFCVGLKSTTFHSSIEQLWVADAVSADAGDTHLTSSPPAHNTANLLSTHQMVVQTPTDPDASLLHPRGLLEHLHLVQQASQVTVNVFDQTWRLKDLCQSPSIPSFDTHYIEQIFENIMPCSIITPIDCFWEGSKLLGPDFPVTIPLSYVNPSNSDPVQVIFKRIERKIKWTNLNPRQLVADMKKMQINFDYHTLENYLKRAGITTGYQEKPCLNPKDPECPDTAPNKNSKQIPDIGAELTSGCYGFAAKYMHWPEDLLIGGAVRNKTGHIKHAKALQTVIQLMDSHEMYEFWMNTWKVHHISWTQEKAAIVLDMWQKRFAQEIKQLTMNNITSPSYDFNSFSTATLNGILKQHSQLNLVKLGISLGLVLTYSWLTDSGLAALGALLLIGSTAAGLGLCSVLGFSMNILSVHILPYLSIGLALRDVYLLLNTYHRCQQTSEVIKRSALTVLSSAICNATAFCTAAIVPIPAFRVFSLQCAILVVFNTAALLIVFPTLISLEIRCRKVAFFCFGETTTPAAAPRHAPQVNNNNEHTKNLLHKDMICQKRKTQFASVISQYLTSVILNPVMRVILFLTYAVLVIFCVFNGLKIEYDISLSMFLPRNTQEYNFLESQNKYFGFYNFYLVTTELEYPLNQQLLYEYHSSLTKVPNVLKDSNGGLMNMNDFWLANFRDFLLDLQTEFDNNLAKNCLNSEKWFPNATEKAVLAFKLLSQTGIVEFPVDKGQILKKKLVSNGIIDPKAFYNYLSVWSSNDQLSYSSSKSNLSPKPSQYYTSKAEVDLKIPKSQPLVYTQMPFYLKNLKTTSKIVETLKEIHSISDTYNKKGLKNYPLGLIFACFDQFLVLDYLLIIEIAVICIVLLTLTCLMVKWTKVWCKMFSVGISMFALSVVNISSLTALFIALHFILVGRSVFLIMTGFISSIGNKERRVKLSLDLSCSVILKGDVALMLCISVWITSEFDFIQKLLLYVIAIIVFTALTNSLIFFPILLSLFGPSAEVVPLEHLDRISTPPPPPVASPIAPRQQPYTKVPRRNQSSGKATTREPSLTTITEESCNQSIVVQPEVVVEYSNPNDSGSSSSGQYTTKVTATTNIKVEVVAPMYRERGRIHRDERPACHRVVCSDKRSKSATKCREEMRSKRDTCRKRCSDRRDECQSHREPCRHACWDEDRDRRHVCDGEKRTRKHRRADTSDTSDSDRDDEQPAPRCWAESERMSSPIESCTPIHAHAHGSATTHVPVASPPPVLTQQSGLTSVSAPIPSSSTVISAPIVTPVSTIPAPTHDPSSPAPTFTQTDLHVQMHSPSRPAHNAPCT